MIEIQNNTLIVSFPEMEAALRARLDSWLSQRLAQLNTKKSEIDLQQLRRSLEAKIHVRATLSFQRTLRLPDNGKTYNLPAGLGRMELEHIEDLRNVSAEAKSRGGVALPMYSGEAMWIQFKAEYPMALRIACGKTCAVSGLPWRTGLKEKPQNYVVLPNQPWLDGFRINANTVRQFVAVPLGSGETVEHFLTGEEHWGGLQIQALPMILDSGFNWLVANKLESLLQELLDPTPASCRIVACSMMADSSTMLMGFAAGAKVHQQVDQDPWGMKSWDTTTTSRVFIHIIHARDWMTASGKPMPRPPLSMKDYQNMGIPWFAYDSQESPVEGGTGLSSLERQGTTSSSLSDSGARLVREMFAEEADYKNTSRQQQAKPHIPDAWNELVDAEDPRLLDLLAEATERRSGVYPTRADLSEFLSGIRFSPSSPSSPQQPVKPTEPNDPGSTPVPPEPTQTHGSWYRIEGKTYTVNNAKNVVLEVLRKLEHLQPGFLERCARHQNNQGRTRCYIGRRAEDLFPDRPDLAQNSEMYEQIVPGWLLMTNFSNQVKRSILAFAASVAHIQLRDGEDYAL